METLYFTRPFKSRIFYEYDEFTGDILINRIIFGKYTFGTLPQNASTYLSDTLALHEL